MSESLRGVNQESREQPHVMVIERNLNDFALLRKVRERDEESYQRELADRLLEDIHFVNKEYFKHLKQKCLEMKNSRELEQFIDRTFIIDIRIQNIFNDAIEAVAEKIGIEDVKRQHIVNTEFFTSGLAESEVQFDVGKDARSVFINTEEIADMDEENPCITFTVILRPIVPSGQPHRSDAQFLPDGNTYKVVYKFELEKKYYEEAKKEKEERRRNEKILRDFALQHNGTYDISELPDDILRILTHRGLLMRASKEAGIDITVKDDVQIEFSVLDEQGKVIRRFELNV